MNFVEDVWCLKIKPTVCLAVDSDSLVKQVFESMFEACIGRWWIKSWKVVALVLEADKFSGFGG